jgi:hypothetical protein
METMDVVETLAAYHADISGRVLRGVVYLDERSRGWRSRVDLDRLDVSDPHRDPLGQAYGCYWQACRELGITSWMAAQMGLWVPCTEQFMADVALDVDVYADLTAAWRAKLA